MAALVIVLTLLVFAAAIFMITRALRKDVRDQIISRDAEVLRAVAMMLHSEQIGAGAKLDETSQFEILLKTSQLKGVMAVRLFDANGKFVASLPVYVRDAKLRGTEIDSLKDLKPIAYFYSDMPVEELFWSDSKQTQAASPRSTPVLETLIPLHAAGARKVSGIAQFIIDGRGVAAEFSDLDRSLLRQALLIFAVGALLMASALFWAFSRLHRANVLLRERSEHLLQANQQLALVRRTSAAGIVSAHLLHEMKSQLFGLKTLLMAGVDGAMDWKTATETTTRLQNLIGQIVEVIRNDQGTTLHYEISLDEIAMMVCAEAEPLAKAGGVNFNVSIQESGTVANSVANLLLIILMNLIQNAIQATPKGKSVILLLSSKNGRMECLVKDEGPGIPAEVKNALFRPVVSRKEGGSGIGLALSKQLANYLDAELEMKETGRNGTVFMLRIPETVRETQAEFA